MNPETTAIFPKPSPLEGHLWARSGKNVGRRYSIGKTEQILGRSPACDIEVEDDRVSLQHAKVVTVEGRHHIYDLGSTNGTFVNDLRVEEAELHDGDSIQIGETVFEYLCNEERALTITLRGSAGDSVVPQALREGAKQMLQRERTTSDLASPIGGAPRDTSPGITRSHPSIPQIPIPDVSLPSIPMLPAVTQSGVPGLGAMNGNGHSMPVIHAPVPYIPPPAPPITNLPVAYQPPPISDLALHHPPPLPAMHAPPAYATATVTTGGEGEPEEKKISVAEILEKLRWVAAILIPYWKSVALFSIIGLALGIASLKAMPGKKTAVFQLGIHQNQAENPVAQYTRVALQFFKSAEQNFVSPVVIRKTLTSLGYTDVDDDDIKDVQDALTFNKMGGGVPGHPSNTTSNTYEGSYKNKNPEEAVRYLDRHLKTYLETEVEKTLKYVQVEVDFLSKQLAEAQEEMNRAEWELLEFKRKNVEALPEQARNIYARVLDLTNRQRELAQEAARTHRAISHTNRKLLFQSPMQEGQITQNRPYVQAIALKQQEIAALESKGSGPQHPDMIKAKEELAKLEALEAESERESTSVKNVNPVYQQAEGEKIELEKNADVQSTHAAQLAQELEEVRAKIADLPEREANYATLQRNFDNAKDTYQKLLAQEKTSKLQLELERAAASARYDIITPVQLEVVNPIKDIGKRVAIGLGGGLFIGIARVAYKLGRRYLKYITSQAAVAAGTPPANPGPTDLVVRS